jgi:asparagine synthase (glutamine-hydrolysing)
MCGIAGFAAAPGRPTLAEERLRAMADAIAHRGPDGDGFHVHGGVSLAHRRLAIIDVAGGDNPLRDADGRAALMYNGEIWNHLALRAELEGLGARPLTHSDGEIVLHGLLHWGLPETLRRVRGMYAFALHDLRSGELHLARDPFGIKPVHWRQTAEGLAFGSEIRAVLAAGGPTPRLDRRGLLQCATLGFTLAPRTAFEGVQALPPGHSATWRDGRLTLQRHHELRWEPGRERADARELWKRLSDTVASHLMSEVPLGAFLSGGVDSSAVVAAMAGRSRDVDAVCVGILEPGLDERPYAREVASALKVRLHEETAAPELAALLPRLVRHLEAPFADTSAAPTFLVCEAARRHVTVALSGDGGDENFAGYRRTRYDVVEQRWRARLPEGCAAACSGRSGRAWPRGTWLPQPLRAGTLLTHLADDWLGAYVDSMARVSRGPRRASCSSPDVATPRRCARTSRRTPTRAGASTRCTACWPWTSPPGCRTTSWSRRPHVRWRTASRCACRCWTRTSWTGPRACRARRACCAAAASPAAPGAARPRAVHRAHAWQAGLPPARRRAGCAARCGRGWRSCWPTSAAPRGELLRHEPLARLAGGISRARTTTRRSCGSRCARRLRARVPGGGVKLLVYTMLYPNARQPHHGVFVRERLLRYRERHGAQLSVVAPVPRARRAWAAVAGRGARGRRARGAPALLEPARRGRPLARGPHGGRHARRAAGRGPRAASPTSSMRTTPGPTARPRPGCARTSPRRWAGACRWSSPRAARTSTSRAARRRSSASCARRWARPITSCAWPRRCAARRWRWACRRRR